MPKNAEINHIILGSVVLRISDIRLQFAAQKTDNQKGIQHNWVYVVKEKSGRKPCRKAQRNTYENSLSPIPINSGGGKACITICYFQKNFQKNFQRHHTFRRNDIAFSI